MSFVEFAAFLGIELQFWQIQMLDALDRGVKFRVYTNRRMR